MATMPSSLKRLQTSSLVTRIQPSILATAVTPRRQAPMRQPGVFSHSLFTLPKEPEDARLTGGTRSLDRRLLALNLAGSLPKRAVASERSTSERSTSALRTAVA
jgi:hypothetical protein